MSTPHVCFADMPQHEGVVNAALQRRHCSSSRSPNSVSPTPRYERNLGFFQQLSRRFGLRSNDDLVSSSAEDDMHSSSTDSCSSTTGTVPPMQSSATSMSSASSQSRHSSTQLTAKDAHGCSMEHISCASSETSSTIDIDEHQQQQQQQLSDSNAASSCKQRKCATRASFSRLHRRSASSLRRAFESFSLTSRSLSCSGATPPPQRSSQPQHNNNSSGSGSTPIKSALKCASNLELNKRGSATACSSSSAAAAASAKCGKSKAKPPPQRILRQPVSYTYLKGISGLPTQRVPRSSVCCQYARR